GLCAARLSARRACYTAIAPLVSDWTGHPAGAHAGAIITPITPRGDARGPVGAINRSEAAAEEPAMFIAMNNFKVNPGREADFETQWRSRESYLDGVPGFIEFALLKGDEPGEYVSHTVWQDREAFIAWTQSQAFTSAHRQGSVAGVLA